MSCEILLVMTGGTICCTEDSVTHKRNTNADSAKSKITKNFLLSDSGYASNVLFDEFIPIDILSENMTLDRLNVLVDFLRGKITTKDYKGIVLLHGTDTPAFTSSLLSLLLCGIDVPVFIVTSHSPLDNPDTNGNDNFRISVELIMNGIAPNVYFVYKNTDGRVFLHYGAHLPQCCSYSNDFYSRTAVLIDENNPCEKGIRFETDTALINKLQRLSGRVLQITPYVGIDYSAFCLDNVNAVVHETFHSQTACAEVDSLCDSYSENSVLSLIERCNKRNIPFILSPCSEESFKYESTSLLLQSGAVPVYGMTKEMTYIKTLVGISLGLNNKDLTDFLNTSFNREFTARF
ncbi:MAG: asparaginase [Clostridia bacterium]|nr:asparaginase [Clostridia bacterium]